MSISVVIVDDHEGFRVTARRLLSREGFDILGEASNASSALSAVRDLRPDLLLVDVVMPGMDGFALVERLAQTFGDDPKAILISSRAVSRSRLRKSPALGFINKADLTGARVADLVDGTK